MFDITRFSAADMVACGSTIRKIGAKSKYMEEVASLITQYLYDNFRTKETKENAFILVRVYKTHLYDDLPTDLKGFAQNISLLATDKSNTQCLTLLGSCGDIDKWNNRKTSSGHQAIPLISEDFVKSLPMVSGLIKALGMEISEVINVDLSIQLEDQTKTYNVFYVADALDNIFIPAQDEFVIPYKIKSVVGFGGKLPSNNIFAVIIFSKIKITKDTALMFKPLARNVQAALLSFENKVFINE